MKKVFKMLKPFRATLLLSILFSALSSVLQILLPIYTKDILSKGVIAKDMDKILYYGGVMLAMTLVGIVTSFLNTYFSTRTSVNYTMHIRNNVFAKVSHLSQSDVDKIGVSSMMTRTINDVRQVHDFILSALKSILPVPIMLIGGIAMAWSVNGKLLKLILLFIPILLLVIVVAMIFIMPMYSKIQKLLDKTNFVLRGKIAGIRVVRAFNRQDYEDDRFNDTNEKLTKLSLRASRIMSTLMPFVLMAAFSIIVYIIYMCIVDATTPGLPKEKVLETIPNMYMFMSYFTMIIGAITQMMAILVEIPRVRVSTKRVNEILDATTDIVESENPITPDENVKGSLEFKNVSFRYKPQPEKKKKKKFFKQKDKKKDDKKPDKKPDEVAAADETPKSEDDAEAKAKAQALIDERERKKKLVDKDAVHDVSFKANAGEVTAIIGLTGSGKSSLINLIPRLYDVTEGQILLDGVDIRDMKLSELHKRIAYVPQQSYLFSGSIKENVKFGKPEATDSEIWKAIEVAQAKTFVSAMDDGIDSFVSQAGKNYSGGQRQRLAIARAVIKQAEFCIFDDSFSALDLATDARVRAALREYLPNSNVIIVAQRVGTVLNADRIIVLDKGEVVGIGKHDELLESCEIYREIVQSQLEEEEDDANE